MIKTLGHQTIEKTSESVSQRSQVGPVKSTIHNRKGQLKNNPPFAGDGYYFWEDNLDAAEWWGLVHYAKKGSQFRIFRIDMTLKYDDNSFFDLIGSRQHLRLLAQLIRKTKMAINCQGWTLQNFITYFRLLESRQKGLFPYKMIRFNDFSLNPKMQNPLSLSNYHHIALMNPFYIICVFEIQDLSLETFIFIK